MAKAAAALNVRSPRGIDNHQLLSALRAFRKGDFTVRLPLNLSGVDGEIADVFNDVVEMNERMTKELERLGDQVGKQGKIGVRARLPNALGSWAVNVDTVNSLIEDLVAPTAEMARVVGAVARGDLSQTMNLEIEGRPLKGEFLRSGKVVNTMVDQLGSFVSEVTRVAREVGTEGKLGGQARVKGVAGTWKDLTDNVNFMAANLTGQVRNIAEVTTAIATGDLSKKITVDVRGEMLELKITINTMVDQLNSFASEVTRVAREVGIEGKLGGQARGPGAAGLWRDLTDNVNQLAANLTNQVRAIAEVSTAVTKGDLTRSITVEALGEVAALKDNINEMIRNLRDQTQKNTEQDWLKTNLARFTRMLQGERDLSTVSNMVLSELAPLVNAQHGVFYVTDRDEQGQTVLALAASYAFNSRKRVAETFRLREGLIGQCAHEKSRILLSNVPSDYVQISSGLGEGPPLNVIVLPALFEGEVNAVIELASFGRFSETHQSFLNQLMESIGIVLNTIAANMRTEGLLKQSQLLTSELQAQQEELKKTNDRLESQAKTLRRSEELLRSKQDELQQKNFELEDKARLLSLQNEQVEAKNREVEQARRELEEKAEQLALTSKYKSEFMANMSHELRTPLNSLLILSKLLAENAQGNLTDKQVEFAHSIHHAGSDLLGLINDILDLSKIESGTVTLDIVETSFASLRDHMDRTFSQIAQDKKLEFTVDLDPDLPQGIYTDDKRLQQIIKNLLSNAFKFTEKGSVKLKVARASSGWSQSNERLSKAGSVLAFTVTDTGIGIPKDKHRVIFESFQQADGTTSRKYGGTGLGLSISRSITSLLGGELAVDSTPGKGSTFTLYLPLHFVPAVTQAPARAVSTQVRAVVQDPPQDMLIDDRETIRRGDPVVLIVEDDQRFAAILLSMAREAGFKGVVTGEGSAVVPLAKRFHPDAITLDIGLPDMDGYALLDRLKRNPETRHIPVHVISADEQNRLGLSIGAYGYSGKPVARDAILATLDEVKAFSHRLKRLLAIEPAPSKGSLANLIGDEDLEIESITNIKEAAREVAKNGYDCVVLDLSVPLDQSPGELIRALSNSTKAVVVFLPREPSAEERKHLNKLGKRLEPTRFASSTAQLQDDIALVLHRPFERLPLNAQAALQQLRRCDPLLAGRKIVVIDDDIRNIFSLTSALEEHGVELHYAESGRSGLEILQRLPDADAVLVDIMMPGMDGYQTIQEIRAMPAFGNLPVFAVTAKAMKGDRQKCIEAGASDYVAKPVDIDQLVSVLRVWFQRVKQTRAMDRVIAPNVVTFRSATGQL